MSPPDAERPGPHTPVADTSPREKANAEPERSAPACSCWECLLYDAADRALDGLQIVELGRLLIVPDVVVIEAAANGLPLPIATRVIRDDGRVAHLFRAPAPAAA